MLALAFTETHQTPVLGTAHTVGWAGQERVLHTKGTPDQTYHREPVDLEGENKVQAVPGQELPARQRTSFQAFNSFIAGFICR